MLACARAFLPASRLRRHVRSMSDAVNVFGNPLPGVVNKGRSPGDSGDWEAAWSKGVTPWEAGKSPPMLSHLIETGAIPVGGEALVPGCGLGHDAATLALAGSRVLGLDLSATAIESCKRRVRSEDQLRQLPAGRLQFRAANFFALTALRPYEVVWDYTFISALPLELRAPWAATMRRLVAPSGTLAVLIFPVADYAGGPPYAMSPTGLDALLTDAGFVNRVLEPVPAHLSFKPRAGREWIGLWQHDVSRFPSIVRRPSK